MADALALVKALLPHRSWRVAGQGDATTTDRPTVDEVATILESMTDATTVIVGDLDRFTAADQERILDQAERAAALGAASHADAAASPQRARPNDTSSYADWLWQRHQQALEALTTLVDELLPGEGTSGPGTATADTEPAWHMADPVGWADRGI